MRWKHDDGGRAAAGFKGLAGDCVTRAVAIASGKPYAEVYDRLARTNASYRGRQWAKYRGKRSARNGTAMGKGFKDYMAELGARWVPTMQVGSGCKVHLRDGELPMGRLVARVSGHMCAVIDGVIHDTYDPGRGGTRCVYGYWVFPEVSNA